MRENGTQLHLTLYSRLATKIILQLISLNQLDSDSLCMNLLILMIYGYYIMILCYTDCNKIFSFAKTFKQMKNIMTNKLNSQALFMSYHMKLKIL